MRGSPRGHGPGDGSGTEGGESGGAGAPRSVRRVLLVGIMGSGKTEVGRLLAHRLGWAFRDFDREIEERTGLSISEIFREHGEEFFRNLEERIGDEFLGEDRVVLAPGGGWPCVPGRMVGHGPGTLSVWLKVDPEEAVLRSSTDGPTRPLLWVQDPVRRVKELLEKRAGYYGLAEYALETTGIGPKELARKIEEIVNAKGAAGVDGTLPSYK